MKGIHVSSTEQTIVVTCAVLSLDRVHNLPWFRSLSWYFLIASNYFFYGESLVDYFGVLVNQTEFLPFLVRYHRFISFSMYRRNLVYGKKRPLFDPSFAL